MGLLQQYQLYHRHQPLPSHRPHSPAAAVLHFSHGTYRLMYDLTHQYVRIAEVGSSDKEHRAHGLQQEVQGHLYIKVVYLSRSSNGQCHL